MQFRQVNENQNRFEIYLAVTSSCEVTISLHEVRGQFVCICDLQLRFWPLKKNPYLLSHAYSSCLLKVTRALELTYDLMHTHRDLTEWRQTLKLISKLFWFFIDLAQLHFCLAYKNSHWAFIDCHTPVILQLGEDKILIYLIEIEFWPNTSYFLIYSHFSDCSLLFDTPGKCQCAMSLMKAERPTHTT